jgi:anti-anti-sigma regulatory factor
MSPTDHDATPPPLRAPERLVAENRLDFRRTALEHVEKASLGGQEHVDIDLGTTLEIDASGLGVLVLVQKRARERQLVTKLLSVSPPVREMLKLTRLDGLFDMVE